MSTCGARPGEKIKSLASLAAAIIDAIRTGVRTIWAAGRPGGAAAPGTAAVGGTVDAAGDPESVDGAGSGFVASTSGVRVGASMQILRRATGTQVSWSRRVPV